MDRAIELIEESNEAHPNNSSSLLARG